MHGIRFIIQTKKQFNAKVILSINPLSHTRNTFVAFTNLTLAQVVTNVLRHLFGDVRLLLVAELPFVETGLQADGVPLLYEKHTGMICAHVDAGIGNTHEICIKFPDC